MLETTVPTVAPHANRVLQKVIEAPIPCGTPRRAARELPLPGSHVETAATAVTMARPRGNEFGGCSHMGHDRAARD
eukprot:9452983-Pyramimonas_sp.AAC.1